MLDDEEKRGFPGVQGSFSLNFALWNSFRKKSGLTWYLVAQVSPLFLPISREWKIKFHYWNEGWRRRQWGRERRAVEIGMFFIIFSAIEWENYQQCRRCRRRGCCRELSIFKVTFVVKSFAPIHKPEGIRKRHKFQLFRLTISNH